jgi:pSer/pThr/pTyr-binding forkhead associated (FHA) protein
MPPQPGVDSDRTVAMPLQVRLGDGDWLTFAFSPVRIGRAESATVQVDESNVSRDHASVRWGTTGWVLTDHSSANGCYVAGRLR